jgi:hypothetical protein
MRTIFHDARLQQQIARQGYITHPLLDSEGLAALSALVSKYMAQYGGDFHTSHFSTDQTYKREVHETITAVVFPQVAALLDRYIPIFGNLMIKPADSGYAMPLHADWTYVDESRYRSLAVWMPLVDTTIDNGRLGVIAGSHRITGQVRGPRIIQSSFRRDDDWARQAGTLLPIRAGEAVIYDHALLHFSPPNRSGLLRPAINLSLVPADAEVMHYCIPEGADSIERYDVSGPEFYLRYDNFQRPETGTPVEKIPISSIELIDERMEAFIKKPSFLKSILERFHIS